MKITITENAKNELINMTKNSDRVAKIILSGRRCIIGTPTLSLALEELKEGDQISTIEGIKIAYSSELDELLEKATIDYEEEGFMRGFSVSIAE